MEKPVTFKGAGGEKLFGVVHIPDEPHFDRKIGINLLNPGLKYRVAPNRLNIKLARRLCSLGYHVLRFDPHGIGDSEGDLEENSTQMDIWSQIQKGLFLEDTLLSNDFFLDQFDLDHLVLMGNCGGAITSMVASMKDNRIRALCLIDVPVFLISPEISFADYAIEGGKRSDWLFTEYMKRILNPRSWYRFFTFSTDYRALIKTLSSKLKKILGLNQSADYSGEIETLCNEGRLNREFFSAFGKNFFAEKPMLFILAGNDISTEFFTRYFKEMHYDARFKNIDTLNLVETTTIVNANHIYTLIEWQESLIRGVIDWIESLPFIRGKIP